MEKNVSIATLDIIGGHPSLDFANTVSARRDRWGPDLLGDCGDLLDWAERTKLFDASAIERLRALSAASPPRSATALARAKRLREALYAAFSAFVAGAEAPADAVELIRTEYLEARAQQTLSLGPTGAHWHWRGALGLDAVTHSIALQAVELLTGPEAARVKECLGHNCGWLFLDTTRNRSRRWCSDADCGTRERVARHRARTRSRTEERP